MSVSGSNQGVRFGVATSTNRPSTPFDGQVIYETDTDRIMCYNGTSWIPEVSAGTIDAKGDLLVGTAADTVARLAVGINGYRVTAASGETTGLKYDMPSVPVFADTTARDAAFGGAGEKTLADGQMCYISAAPKRLQVYNGTAWLDFDGEYTSFTPTISNYTRGNGTSQAYYVRLGKFVSVYVRELLGSTSSVTGNPVFTLPFAAPRVGAISPATLVILDQATIYYYGVIHSHGSTTTATMRVTGTGGTYAQEFAISSTVPMTWTTNDEFQFTINYEVA